MIKVPKDMIISKIKEKAGLSDSEINSKVKDKLDQLSGLISEEGALHIIANELGVKILDDAGKLQVKNVLAGMRNVEISAKVVKIYEVREFNKENRKGKVGNFLVGDETGVIRVVAWNDKADLLTTLSEGDIVKIQNGYSRDNRGRAEIHLGDKTLITINPKDSEKIEVKERIRERRKIADLKDTDENVEIMGATVQVFDPRFFTVDPETGKRVVEKEGKYYLNDQLVDKIDHSYVTNLFLDDGTENIRVVLWKNQTQNLFGMSHEEILAKMDKGFEDTKNELLGKIVKFTGKTNRNEMFDRVEFIASFVDTKPDPNEEIKRVKQEISETKEEEKLEEPAKKVASSSQNNSNEELIGSTKEESISKPKVELKEESVLKEAKKESFSIPVEEPKEKKELTLETEEVETVSIDVGLDESKVDSPSLDETESIVESIDTKSSAVVEDMEEPTKDKLDDDVEDITDIEEIEDLDSI